MKIKFLGTTSRAKMAHPHLSVDSLTPPPPQAVVQSIIFQNSLTGLKNLQYISKSGTISMMRFLKLKHFLEGKPKLYSKQYQNVVFEANKKSF